MQTRKKKRKRRHITTRNPTRNKLGPHLAKLRKARSWSRARLAIKFQLRGFDISPQIVANVESRRTRITDIYLFHFQEVFRLDPAELSLLLRWNGESGQQ